MSNILPHEAKKAVWSMYRARFMIAGSLIALLVAGLSALSLLPSYLALHAADSTQETATASSLASDDDRAALASLKSMMAALSPIVSATTTPTSAISYALTLKPPTISIDHISYTTGQILLAGSTATREAIGGFRQTLSLDPHFKGVSIPVGDLTGAPGARFSLTLSGNF